MKRLILTMLLLFVSTTQADMYVFSGNSNHGTYDSARTAYNDALNSFMPDNEQKVESFEGNKKWGPTRAVCCSTPTPSIESVISKGLI